MSYIKTLKSLGWIFGILLALYVAWLMFCALFFVFYPLNLSH